MTRKICTRISNLRNKYSGIVEMAEKDWLKIQELQQKKIYDREEIEYIMKYIPMIIDVGDVERKLFDGK